MSDETPRRTPYVLGVAGSVAVGKSTLARILQALLARWTGDARWANLRPPLRRLAAAATARLADEVAALPGYRRPAA